MATDKVTDRDIPRSSVGGPNSRPEREPSPNNLNQARDAILARRAKNRKPRFKPKGKLRLTTPLTWQIEFWYRSSIDKIRTGASVIVEAEDISLAIENGTRAITKELPNLDPPADMSVSFAIMSIECIAIKESANNAYPIVEFFEELDKDPKDRTLSPDGKRKDE